MIWASSRSFCVFFVTPFSGASLDTPPMTNQHVETLSVGSFRFFSETLGLGGFFWVTNSQVMSVVLS